LRFFYAGKIGGSVRFCGDERTPTPGRQIDPEEDRKRFHVTDKGVTLITPAMLGQPLQHLH